MRGSLAFIQAKSVSDKMYDNSIKLPSEEKDKLYTEYIRLIRKAAYSGHAEAQFELGLQYEEMNYLNIENPYYDPIKSLYWYEKACAQNHPEACYNLGGFYEMGKFVGKDEEKEMTLYLKAFNLGLVEAGYALAKIYKDKNDFNEATLWLKRVLNISPNDGEAMFELAKLYYEGLGVKKSFKTAYTLFLKSLSTNFITEYTKEEIFFYIGKMYFCGQYVKKSIGKAKYLFQKANVDNDHYETQIFFKSHQKELKNINEIRIIL